MTRKRSFRWLLAIFGGIFVGAAAFLGAVATNLLTDDIEQLLAPYQMWIWVVFWVALGVAILVAIVSFWPQPAAEAAADPTESRLPRAGAGATTVAEIDEAENVVVGQGNTQTDVKVDGDVKVFAPGGQVDYHEYGSVGQLTIASATFAAPPGGEVDPEALLLTYLKQVVADTSTLNLTGVDRKTMSEREEARLELAAVYTALDTVAAIEPEARGNRARRPADGLEERRRQPVLAFAAAAPYAALLGDPGSGKTTFTNYLALCLAGEMLGLRQANLATLGEAWTPGALLPVRVVLREFAAQLNSGAAHDGRLWDFIVRRLGQNLAGFAPFLQKHLLEQGGLLILDGLDEVPEANQRRVTVKQAVMAFKRQFPQVRVLLTSRTYAYQRQEWRLPDFAEAVLADFDPDQIDAFVDRWYVHMAQVRRGLTDAPGRAELLKQAIRRYRYLAELAPRPLLLTLMASLHAWRGGHLPEDRQQLYEESVDLLLDIWEQPKVIYDDAGKQIVQAESAAEWFRAPREQVRKALDQLAFQVHGEQATLSGAADIDEARLVGALLRAADNPDLRHQRVVEYIRDRAGLLTNRGEGVYSFPHRTFQEYLAARHLTVDNFPAQLVRLVRGDTERWREVLLLAGAKVGRGTPFAVWSLAQRLCPQECAPAVAAVAADTDWWAALLAGQLLLETGIYAAPQDVTERATLALVRGWLAALVSGGKLPPPDRHQAGIALGRLGDPRPGVGVKDGLPAIAWQPVDAGPFLMGSDKRKDSRAYDDELRQFTCTLIRQPYRISRYPITVAQYQAFIDAQGYDREDLWTQSGWQWRRQKRVSGPRQFAEVFQTPNHPQVGVSWYEATAFCTWLSRELGQPVRLPSEAEWERAARHTDGRSYPWGDAFDQTACNNGFLNLGSSSSVGIFPTGDSVCGTADMSGNVWEWTATKAGGNYQNYAPDDYPEGSASRPLRGGSFDLNGVYLVRCACRYRTSPDSMGSNVGFRVVSPGF